MVKNELSIALTKLRMSRLAESQGHSSDEAKAMAENAIREGGVSDMMAMATPEGSIVTIVETYLWFTRRSVELGGPDHFEQANDEALAAIEAHRSNFCTKGLSTYPKNIDDYVFYRINLEIRDKIGCDAEEIGLDKQTTKMLTQIAKANLTKMMMGESGGNGSKSCFVATACFGSSDNDTVVTLRRYREVVLKISTVGRFSIYWYYKLSPPIANFVSNHRRIKTIVQCVLVRIAKKLSTKHGL